MFVPLLLEWGNCNVDQKERKKEGLAYHEQKYDKWKIDIEIGTVFRTKTESDIDTTRIPIVLAPWHCHLNWTLGTAANIDTNTKTNSGANTNTDSDLNCIIDMCQSRILRISVYSDGQDPYIRSFKPLLKR